MFKDIFHKTKYVTLPSTGSAQMQQQKPPVTPSNRKEIPDGLWIKCPSCGETLFKKAVAENFQVCSLCNYHFRVTSQERLDLIADPGSFEEWDVELHSNNPLDFPGYEEKLVKAKENSNQAESVLTGRVTIEGLPAVLAINEGNFMMGSMGSVTGEKITRAIERSIELRLPVIIFSTSGGARMQEGILALYQMAKTSAALARLSENHLLYISVMTDPTFGGVTASYASLGDIQIAEPGALIGFTGPRVIKQTMRQDLPPGAQTAEFNQEHGLIDLVVERSQMRSVLARLLRYHQEGEDYGTTLRI